jgi:SWI/SNF-related matrix-associated actin-dependent regulator 1 of chromatin subfamily A
VPLRISSKTYASYVEAEKEFLEWAETNRAKYLSENKYSELLRQLTYVGKRDQILSWIEDFMETDRKLVVFAYHKKVIDDIYSKFKSIAVVLSGDTPEKQRFEVQKQFQNNPDIKLFIGQIEAAGVGITLTSAADVAFVELLYTPDDLFQAEDRVHRIGQTKQVTIYYLVAADTIEEDVIEILDRKTKTISQIVEGEEKKFFGEHDFLQELLLQAKQRELS